MHTDGTPSNVFHNDDFGDAHLDPGTLRHATSCWADSFSPSSPLSAAVCRRYVIRQSIGESIRWHITAHGHGHGGGGGDAVESAGVHARSIDANSRRYAL